MEFHWNPALSHSSEVYDFLDQNLKGIICLTHFWQDWGS